MRLSVLLVILVAVALALFNPTMQDFEAFARTHSERLLLKEIGDSSLGQALSGAGASLAGAYISRITERRGYVLFSTYTVDLDGETHEENEWRFLGIGGQFVELQKPEALRQEEDRP